MGHKILIDGIACEVQPSPVLVDGIKYQIGGGRTLIDGIGRDIAFAASLIWYMNDTVTAPTSAKTYYVNFRNSGRSYTRLYMVSQKGYVTLEGYNGSGYEDLYDNGWRRRTDMIFEEPPTGDLLAWLKENGVPQ